MAICTLEQYKSFISLQNPADPHKNDANNQLFLDAMEAAVIGYIDSALELTVVTNQMFDGKIEDIITPGEFPIVSVERVALGVEGDGTGGHVLDPNHDYYFDDVSIILRCGYTTRGRGRVRIDYTHGYSNIPADIKLAILQATKIFSQYTSSDAEHVGSRSKKDESESIGGTKGGVWDEDSGLPTQVKAMLQKYRFYGYPNVGHAQRTR